MTDLPLSPSAALARLCERLRARAQNRPQVLISACLAGQNVRYDGREKSLGQALSSLATTLQLVQHCPEMDAGMGVPRAPIHWVQPAHGEPQLQWLHAPGTPVAYPLRERAELWCQQHPGLNAAIVKARSPSCGHGTTPLHIAPQRGQALDDEGQALQWLTDNEEGQALIDGVFTECLKHHHPQLAIVDESYFLHEGATVWDRHWFILGVYLHQLQREAAPDVQALISLTPWAQDLTLFLATEPHLRQHCLQQLIESEW